MSADRITRADLDSALAHHIDALAACGVTYTGELHMSIGSKTYGVAYRLFRTNVPTSWTCDACGEGNLVGSVCGCGCDEHSWKPIHPAYHTSSGHHSPPVGSDYLGMTAREAWEQLTTRTRVLWDVAHAQKNGGRS